MGVADNKTYRDQYHFNESGLELREMTILLSKMRIK